MIPGRTVPFLVFCFLLFSCGSQQNRSPALAEAFVGPSTLNLRQELSLKAPVSATVHHGEPLDILEYKRRFIKVRTAGGIVGWTDVRQLMTPEQMAGLRHMDQTAAAYPSQGVATTQEELNVHTEPSRASPNFLIIPANGKMDVIGHRVTPRIQAPAPNPAPPPKPRPQRHRKEKSSAKIPPPPMPAGPKLPDNWIALSQTPPPVPAKIEAVPETPAAPAAPVRMDDWTLIRTKDGKVGWALSRMLTMAIPEDVAQYAEGRRITSYFSMGDVRDNDQVKHNYLWTTLRSGAGSYEFDSWRFFTWSRHRHRYETAYIQRDVIGHYPIHVDLSGPEPSFTLILQGDDEKLYKKTFTFNGYRVSLTETVPYEMPSPESHERPSVAIAQAQVPKGQSWYSSMKERITKLFQR